MGYQTDFDGAFSVSPPLSEAAAADLFAFSNERHDDRTGEGWLPGMPGIWCQWVPGSSTEPAEGEDRVWDLIEWDQGEKFYNYVEWIEWLIDNKLAPKGYVLNGQVDWEGEESGDLGQIVITDNVVRTRHAEISYVDDS